MDGQTSFRTLLSAVSGDSPQRKFLGVISLQILGAACDHLERRIEIGRAIKQLSRGASTDVLIVARRDGLIATLERKEIIYGERYCGRFLPKVIPSRGDSNWRCAILSPFGRCNL